jgi:signal transduction histidine kinase
MLVGVMAVEFRAERTLAALEVELLEGLAQQVALAVDNARWFARLRTVGAEQERTRIARELHDNLGQSLAYLAFELDRIAAASGDPGIQPDLAALRQDVRKVVGEVRDTLYDLRTDVSEGSDLVATLEEFLDRVRSRTGRAVILRHAADHRLRLPQEREMWRIAQEAVTNAERHSDGRTISVTWRCTAREAVLEVVDDGRGFDGERPGRLDSYGILGMRERADAIGATLNLDSTVGKGTSVRCVLGLS